MPHTRTGETFPPFLVLGLGNVLRQDEGAGLHVLRRLEKGGFDEDGVQLLDGGTGGLHLVGELAGREGLVVVDAADLGAVPGTVRILAGEEMERFVNRPSGWNVHDVGLPDLFAAAALLPEGLPSRRAVVAIQPAGFEWSAQPSAPVGGALPEAVRLVRRQIAAWQAAGVPERVGQ